LFLLSNRLSGGEHNNDHHPEVPNPDPPPELRLDEDLELNEELDDDLEPKEELDEELDREELLNEELAFRR